MNEVKPLDTIPIGQADTVDVPFDKFDDVPSLALAQQHKVEGTYYESRLSVAQDQIGFVTVQMQTDETTENRRLTEGILRLDPDQARKLAEVLVALARVADGDRLDPENCI